VEPGWRSGTGTVPDGTTCRDRKTQSGLPLAALALAVVSATSVFDSGLSLVTGAVVGSVILATRLATMTVGALEIFAIALTVLYAMSLLWAIDFERSRHIVAYQVGLLLMFLAVRAVATSRREIVLIACGYVLGCVCAVILLIRQNPGVATGLERSRLRYGIDGLNVNYLGYALATGLVAAVVAVCLARRRTRMAMAVLIPAAGMVFGIVQTGSRGALAAALLVVIWSVVHRHVGRFGVEVMAAAVGVLSLMLASGLLDDWLRVVDSLSWRSTGDLANRLYVWPLARTVFADHWVTGIGAGGLRSMDLGIGAHNAILELGCGLGVLGVVLFVGWLVSGLLGSTRNAAYRTLLVGGALACWAPMLMSGHWELAPPLWILLGLLSRLHVVPNRSADGKTPAMVRRYPCSADGRTVAE